MRKTIIASALISAFALASAGCFVRSPDKYRDDTRALLESNNGPIKTCYDALIKGDSSASGTVTVFFVVSGETGVIKEAKVLPEQSTAPENVQQCVTDSITGLKLAPPDDNDGHATFTFEFEIAPQASAATESGFTADS